MSEPAGPSSPKSEPVGSEIDRRQDIETLQAGDLA